MNSFSGVVALIMVCIAGAVSIMLSTAKDTDAKVVAANMTQAAENFELDREIVFLNTQTNDVSLQVAGKCDVTVKPDTYTVLCRTGKSQYKKLLVGRNTRMTMIVDQVDGVPVNAYHRRVILKPSTVFNTYELNLGAKDELPETIQQIPAP